MNEKHELARIDIVSPTGKVVHPYVDKDIAPLIQKFNDKGFRTLYSCSGHEEDIYRTMYIQFMCLNDEKTEALLDILSKESLVIVDVLHVYTSMNGSQIILKNPSTHQKYEAYCIMEEYSDKFVHGRKIRMRYFRHEEEEDLENLDRNRREVLEIFKNLETALDAYD